MSPLRAGDVVHWPGDPDDLGDVQHDGPGLVVVWRREPDEKPDELWPVGVPFRDCNELDEEGNVTDLSPNRHGQLCRVVLVPAEPATPEEAPRHYTEPSPGATAGDLDFDFDEREEW